MKRLEYLESTGTQYIDTGFKPNQNSGIDIDIDSTNCEGMSYPSPFGSRGNGTTSYNNNQFFIGIQSNETNKTWFFRYGTQTIKTTYGEKYGRNHIVINKNKYTLNNDSYTFTEATFQSNYNIFLFGYNCNGSLGQGSNGLFHGKIYSCKIYDNNTLVRDFIPVLDDNDVPCLYDNVTNQFYYNQGTGNFTYVEKKFKKIMYLESSGTQYIDTGVYGGSNTRIKMKFQMVTKPTTDYMTVYGIWNSRTQNRLFYYTSTSKYATQYYTLLKQGMTIPTDDSIIEIDQNRNVYKVNGNTVYTGSSTSFSSTIPIYLFSSCAMNYDTQSLEPQWNNNATSRMYDCQIYVDDVLVRDYIPVIDENNIPCMYDKLSDAYYYNQGIGSFTAGPVIDVEKKIYLGVNGVAKRVQKIYVGVNNVAKEVVAVYLGVNDVAKKII